MKQQPGPAVSPDQQELLMRMMATGAAPDVAQPQLSDPNAIDWGALAQQLQLTPEEMQQLQIAAPEGGPGLEQRLQALRPNMNLGNIQLGTNGRKITAKMPF